MHLHVHSYYSFLAGTLSIQHLLEEAQRGNCRAIALTDTNNLTGVTEFYSSAREAGIKPILGAEVRDGRDRAVLLAKNWDGYEEICRTITSLSHAFPAARISNTENDDGFKSDQGEDRSISERSITLSDLLANHSENVFIITKSERLVRKLSQSHSNNLYIEITKADEGRWPQVLKLKEETGSPLVATNDVYFGKPAGRTLHTILRAIATNTTMGTIPVNEAANETQYFCSEDEYRRWFQHYPEALMNREIIAEQCNVEFDFHTSKFTPFNDGDSAAKLELLRALTEEGLHRRYARPSPRHHERVEKEFSIIRELGFVDYFLVAWDIVRYAKHGNIPYVGRGSGANSIVAYCLEITNVDPIELNLFFERFLNPERKSPPDFDIDFSWRNRDEVIDYVLKKYDEQNTAMICTLSTFNPRGAIREVGKALGYSEAEIKQVTSLLPSYGSVRDLSDPSSPFHRYGGMFVRSPYGKDWMKIAMRILDFPNHYGIHAGGVILAPHPITRYTPTQVAPKGVRITQQDMFAMEDWRLEKLDILSTRGLGTFEDTMKAVELRTGTMPPILDYRFACEDVKTKEIVRMGRTIGCFYIESPAMIQLLKKLRADSFEMLTAASSIIRPGVSQSGMMQAFIERFHDPRKIKPPHPMMAELLESTFGVMVYQEDVIKVAHFIGKLSLGEADLLRRAMSGKMRSHEAMRKLKGAFFNGCRSQGISDQVTAEIWRQMESFAGYSFCKAHSASYAVLSFQEAYLKAHYPALFLCSVLNNQGGYYRAEVYVQEAKRLGIMVLLPDVNTSEYLNICPTDTTIQLGFLHVKNLSERSVNSILYSRNDEGTFTDCEDFFRRSRVTLEDAITLVRCGACDSLGEDRPAMIVQAKLHFRNQKQRRLESELPLKFERFSDSLSTLRSYSAVEVAQIELESFSFTVSSHVLDAFHSQLAGTVRANELSAHIGKHVTVGGWMIAAKLSRTRKGERMMFMNLDDSTGMIDVVLFPKCYQAHAYMLRSAGPFKVRGKVVREFDVINIIGEQIELLSA